MAQNETKVLSKEIEARNGSKFEDISLLVCLILFNQYYQLLIHIKQSTQFEE
jgi:hypothetical protein